MASNSWKNLRDAGNPELKMSLRSGILENGAGLMGKSDNTGDRGPGQKKIFREQKGEQRTQQKGQLPSGEGKGEK